MFRLKNAIITHLQKAPSKNNCALHRDSPKLPRARGKGAVRGRRRSATKASPAKILPPISRDFSSRLRSACSPGHVLHPWPSPKEPREDLDSPNSGSCTFWFWNRCSRHSGYCLTCGCDTCAHPVKRRTGEISKGSSNPKPPQHLSSHYSF